MCSACDLVGTVHGFVCSECLVERWEVNQSAPGDTFFCAATTRKIEQMKCYSIGIKCKLQLLNNFCLRKGFEDFNHFHLRIL